MPSLLHTPWTSLQGAEQLVERICPICLDPPQNPPATTKVRSLSTPRWYIPLDHWSMQRPCGCVEEMGKYGTVALQPSSAMTALPGPKPRIHEILQDWEHAKTHQLNECPAKWNQAERLYEVTRDVKLEPETAMGNANATGRNTEGKRQGIRNGFLEVSTVNTPFYPSIVPPVPLGLLSSAGAPYIGISRLVAYTKLSRGGLVGTS
ncbi:hypothetical protein B0H13DRAFT_2538195 [Mycena leptocephala]|nr:hypothetical protein B0H13DRAFT_2538195 [Mycena leptocephala]